MKKINLLILVQVLFLFSNLQANPNAFEKAIETIATTFRYQADKLANLNNVNEKLENVAKIFRIKHEYNFEFGLEYKYDKYIKIPLGDDLLIVNGASFNESNSIEIPKDYFINNNVNINNTKELQEAAMQYWTKEWNEKNHNKYENFQISSCTLKKNSYEANKATITGVATAELTIIGLLGFSGYKFINNKYLNFVINQIKAGKLDEQINQEDKLKKLKKDLLKTQSEEDKEKIISEMAKILASNKNIFGKIKSLISNK